MSKLKVRDIEGEPQDIHQLLEKQGCKLSGYIGAEAPYKVSILWMWASIIAFFIAACCLWIGGFNSIYTKIIILAVFTLWGLVVSVVYYKFRNNWLTAIVAIVGFAIVLMSNGVYSPQEVAKKIEDIAHHEIENKSR